MLEVCFSAHPNIQYRAFFEYPLYAAYLGIIRERQSVYDSCHSTKCVRILGA